MEKEYYIAIINEVKTFEEREREYQFWCDLKCQDDVTCIFASPEDGLEYGLRKATKLEEYLIKAVHKLQNKQDEN